MRRLTFIIAIIALVIAAGCVTKVERIGCCLRANASDLVNPGCALFNTTTMLPVNPPDKYMGLTNGCNMTTLNCNVTFNDLPEKYRLVPVCTDEEIKGCIAMNCTAMVCGDFAFKPRAAPGYTDMSEASGNAPPTEDEGGALNFYKAQCRFLPMDVKLKNIMKNSKSSINVFRMGVGGSFDEFEQYRNFFPMSDKYCNLNQPQKEGDTRIDRYMNYLSDVGGNVVPYDTPTKTITDNCVNDASPPPPFGFSETYADKVSYLNGIPVGYTTKIPDTSNYKTAHFMRFDASANWITDQGGFYQYQGGEVPYALDHGNSVFKKVDESFYRKYLAIAHADDIYDTGKNGTARAPFECDMMANDCYSASCDTSVYMRGALVETSVTTDKREIVGDCVKDRDEVGLTRVICNPTTGVTLNGAATAPTIDSAPINVRPALMIVTDNPGVSFDQLNDQDNDLFVNYWNALPGMATTTPTYVGAQRTITSGTDDLLWYYEYKKNCPWDYGDVTGQADENDTIICSWVYPSATKPSIGGAVFFGKSGEAQVQYQGKDIIGYALATPSTFKDLYVVKNCKMNMTQIFPTKTSAPAEFQCWNECRSLCSGTYDIDNKCDAWCTEDTPDMGNPPCVVPPEKVTETNDFIKVDVPGPNGWGPLITAFEPYYRQRIKAIMGSGFDDGCGQTLDILDGVISSMPWIVNYEKGIRVAHDPPFESTTAETSIRFFHLSSSPAQYARTRNIYDEAMSGIAGTSSCEMRRTHIFEWAGIGQHLVLDGPLPGQWHMEQWWPPYYDILYSDTIYLFKYNESIKSVGRCAVDDSTKLPEVKTFGWCRACTTSTLAYQKLNVQSRVYMPAWSANVENTAATNIESICQVNMKTDWDWDSWFGGTGGIITTDNVSCFNTHITDMQEYKDSIAGYGSPKTIPEATIVKERTGDYMKSGVLPVFDMSDMWNWDRSNPDCDPNDDGTCKGMHILWWDTGLFGPEKTFLQYDFQRLFGNMGAAVVIVEHVRDASDAENPEVVYIGGLPVTLPPKIERIKARGIIVRDFCPTCLVAIHVDSPPSSDSFAETIQAALDPETSPLVDMVTFDYPVTMHNWQTNGNATLVAEDLQTYGLAALKAKGKATMIVGFNVDDNDGYWNDANYKTLFDTIVNKQDKLVKAGITGIIYMPARTDAVGESNGEFVDSRGISLIKDATNVGKKGAKFCALQDAMYRMTSVPPNALFTKTMVANTVNCTPCTSLDITQNDCGLPDPQNGHTAPVCDDGVECTPLSGMPVNQTKCPENTIVSECPLCKSLSGQVKCSYFYGNGTIEHKPVYQLSEISTDAYMDVLAGLPKPLKCCITDEKGGFNYTYTKKTIQSPLNKPIVFPKTGDPNVDCGFGGTIEDATKLSTFCNIQAVPFKDYDVKCCVDCADYPN